MLFKKVTIVGVGLLGGSLGLAIARHGLAEKTVGYVRRAASITECQQVGVVNHCTQDIGDAVAGADLVVLCTPLARMRPLVDQMLPNLSPGAIVTDVGSVKETVVKDLEEVIHSAKGHFIGSHPMAGGEKMGVTASRVDLFERAVCVVTPTEKTHAKALEKVDAFWRAIGMKVMKTTPAMHDELVSRSSHLPHLVASQLARFVLSPQHPPEQSALCATGFRDTTRIASGSPEMWRDITVANRQKLSEALGTFIADLESLKQKLNAGDEAALEKFFIEAKELRDGWRLDCEKSNGNSAHE